VDTYIYAWSEKDYLKRFTYSATANTVAFSGEGTIQSGDSTPEDTGSHYGTMPGGMLSVSADGSKSGTGIVWATIQDPSCTGPVCDAAIHLVNGRLYAFDAENLGAPLYMDLIVNYSKLTAPTVVDGRVYVATDNGELRVYGVKDPAPGWSVGFSSDALVLGHDDNGMPLYACRASYAGSVQVGKTRSDWGSCDIGYGGGEHWVTPYETLGAPWIAASNGRIPAGAPSFGADVDGAPLYVCRAAFGGTKQVGKIRTGWSGCDFAYGGRAYTLSDYEVLAPQGFKLAYQAATTQLPPTSVAGGVDSGGTTLYPCAVNYQGHLQLGKTRPDWHLCDIEYGGREYPLAGSTYSTLGAFPLSAPLNGAAPYFVGTDSNGLSLGVCATVYGSAVQVGKYFATGACSFAYGGTEILATTYSVLAK
jgi:hypothetical protein